jgi:phenylalanyl-tRNA synthetase alpha subunit
MSFTEDELQSFNNILEQRLSAQSREMEQAFDQRISALRRDMEERLAATQQDILRSLSLKIAEQQNMLNTSLSQNLSTQQAHIISAFNRDVEQRQQHIDGTIDSMLAAQLLGIEQLLDQRLSHPKLDDMAMPIDEVLPQLDTIEVQTDLTWEDLSDVIGKALDQRLSVLHESTQSAIRNLEQDLSARLYGLREELLNSRAQVLSQPFDEMPSSMQEVLRGIDHLERIIESMQVAMTSNHALLSNRLYHHQQLPLERAHPTSRTHATSSNGVTAPLPIVREHHENSGQTDMPESEGKGKPGNSI